jgi:hypothetical protein
MKAATIDPQGAGGPPLYGRCKTQGPGPELPSVPKVQRSLMR